MKTRKQFRISRRAFCATSLALPWVWVRRPMAAESRSFEFQPYRPGRTLCPVTKVTPDDGYYIHTFFDRSPISPSGRHLVCLRMPFQDRAPEPGDKAEICLVDLENQTIETLYATAGWDAQTAAHQQWGPSGRYVYFTDVQGHMPVIVRYDVAKRSHEIFEGPLYQVSPDETWAASVDLRIIGATQAGYGVIIDPKFIPEVSPGASADDGLWKTDFRTGKKSLVVSYADAFEAIPRKERFEGGTIYGFHVKFNRDGSRMMLVVRNLPPEGRMQPMLVTFRPDGSDIRLALDTDIWSKGGHHPDWHPNGEDVTHNLKIDGTMRFCQFRYDGSNFRVLRNDILGGGHPSFHVDGRWLVTDAYVGEPVVPESKEVPIRFIDMPDGPERNICTIWTFGKNLGVLRCDPHPAWSFDFRKIAFNGAPNDRKGVFIADVGEFVEG